MHIMKSRLAASPAISGTNGDVRGPRPHKLLTFNRALEASCRDDGRLFFCVKCPLWVALRPSPVGIYSVLLNGRLPANTSHPVIDET